MTRGDWYWLTFGGVCVVAGVLLMAGSAAGWWTM